MTETPSLTSTDTGSLGFSEHDAEGEAMYQLGAYLRISDDDRDPITGELSREGVTRQLKDCRVVAAEMGGDIVKVYDDNDVSASDPFVVRKDFEALVKDLDAGVIDGFVFYHSDRVARLAYDAARICQCYERKPKLVGRAAHGGTDLSTDNGRAMFVMQAVMGGVEASSIRRRKTNANRHNALSGKDHIGRLAWGWDEEGNLVQPYADLRKKAVTLVAKGGSISDVVRMWAENGITTESGQPVLYKTAMLRVAHPRNAGFRAYLPAQERRGKATPWGPDIILYGDDGKPVTGKWTPLVDPETYWAAIHRLEKVREESKNAGRTGGTRPGHRTHLLSGLLRCGDCGTRMVASARTIKGKKVPFYRCPTTNNGCGGITRSAAALEDHIESLCLAAIRKIMGRAKPSGAKEQEEIDQAENRLREIATEIKEVMDRRKPGANKRISATSAMDMISELEEERGMLNYRIRELSAKADELRGNTPDLLKDWKKFTTDRKRHEIGKLMKAIVVEKAPRGRHFDPASVDVAWQEQAS
ncbi:recombinase family protein [Streptomyces sp. DSM 41527]|uniref:Recombinase family protein n=1 Tax=Streptomyces mooreae TaxID=3075523 RepID=A0ABU2TB00_9ACTN|nr:recombinase family protein [Streptomyces sp. DSM 41527]MDT0458115.1 recombinase family protein [Streptomyces sp. DSM 41527]